MVYKKRLTSIVVLSLLLTVLTLFSPIFIGTSAAKPIQRQRPYRMYIGGTLAPGYGKVYGPFRGCILLEVIVVWTPADQDLFIGINTAPSGDFWGVTFYDGFAYVGFGVDMYKSYWIGIKSVETNTKTLTYSGYIYYWRPY